MLQYYTLNPEYIVTPNGGTKKVLGFRDRLTYNGINQTKIAQGELIRIDLLCTRISGGVLEIGKVVDVNEKDILSFSENEFINAGFN